MKIKFPASKNPSLLDCSLMYTDCQNINITYPNNYIKIMENDTEWRNSEQPALSSPTMCHGTR